MIRRCRRHSSTTWTRSAALRVPSLGPYQSAPRAVSFEILIFTFVLEAADVVVEEQDVKSGVLLSPRKPFLFYVVHGLLFHVNP
ncbi:hypothetical protein OIU74_000642 [Salix koriyanagi]|uniref:Uncharacterized protein n=1 Tax=Salix koriyanagi TaxID=2511006 RepID=A0A9Q1AM57_9ROSI|nr:hypothetical protein OIU74_000642 [Salix koriyanagi]